MEVKIEKSPTQERLNQLGVKNWPIWQKEVSIFPWEYDAEEVCYILEGKVTVTPENQEPVEIEKGDLVTFPRGMKCEWDIKEDIKKHFDFR